MVTDPEHPLAEDEYLPSSAASTPILRDNDFHMEPATTESDSMSTTQDSDIDLTDDSSSRPETPDLPQVELAPTPRPSSPTPTYTVEVTENQSNDANVDRFVQIIEEQNRLLARELEIQSQLTSSTSQTAPAVSASTSSPATPILPPLAVPPLEHNTSSNDVVVRLPVGTVPTTITTAPTTSLPPENGTSTQSTANKLFQLTVRGSKCHNRPDVESVDQTSPPRKLTAIETVPKVKQALPAPPNNAIPSLTSSYLPAIESGSRNHLALPPPDQSATESSLTLYRSQRDSPASRNPDTSLVIFPHPSYMSTFSFSSIAMYCSSSETTSLALLGYDPVTTNRVDDHL